MALRTPAKRQPVGTYTRKKRESQRDKGLRFKLSPNGFREGGFTVLG